MQESICWLCCYWGRLEKCHRRSLEIDGNPTQIEAMKRFPTVSSGSKVKVTRGSRVELEWRLKIFIDKWNEMKINTVWLRRLYEKANSSEYILCGFRASLLHWVCFNASKLADDSDIFDRLRRPLSQQSFQKICAYQLFVSRTITRQRKTFSFSMNICKFRLLNSYKVFLLLKFSRLNLLCSTSVR